jgi:subtilisin family serine protease
MKTLLRSNLLAALFGAALALYPQVSAAPSAQASFAGAATSQYVPGEVLVKFKSAAIARERTSSVAAFGHTILAHLDQSGWTHVKLGAGQLVTEALVAYQSDPKVEYVQPNYIYHAAAVPNDTQYGQLWAFKNTGQIVTTGTYLPKSGTPGDDINIEPAWGHITDCSSVVVAVVDSGVNYNQEDLAANMWNGGPNFPNHGHDFVDDDNDPMDLNGHGTHVAGIIGAVGSNNQGTTGVCQKASIMAVRVLDSKGRGTTAGILQGVNFAVANGAKVINMSLGGGGFDPAFNNAITAAQASDVVVVVSAGNENSDNDAVPAFPCNFTQLNLVCVAALDQNYTLASFSNFGAISVDVGAPGTNIVSTWAGTETTISDDFNTNGMLDWTNSGGWAYRPLTLSGSPVDVLVNPSTFPTTGTYANGADNRVYKTFDLSGKNAATLDFLAQIAIQPGDSLNLNYRSGGGDPFVGGVQLSGGSENTGGFVVPFSFDLSPCISATCSVGFQLLSDATNADQGAGISRFSITTLQLNAVTYHTISGTSMASPVVAGLAAMLRAYNPQYTYTDTLNAIKNGGKSVPALAGKTTSGKAVDAMSSLAYINAPTGLTVQ